MAFSHRHITENPTAHLGFRITQFIFALIVLGLTGYVASWWNGWYNDLSPGEINFLIFASVWTFLTLIYLSLVPTRFAHPTVHHHYAVLGVEALTMIFWFAGFIALAVFLTGRSCVGSVCGSADAAAVFAAFEWVLFLITTILAAMTSWKGAGVRVSRREKAAPNVVLPEGV